MELFYSKDISKGITALGSEESSHCVKVLRHRKGDTIHVIDGRSLLYRCTITDDNPHSVQFTIDEAIEGYGTHNYHLHMAVAPPKNIDRFEWFAEKATEIGVDEITPLFGEYSERKVFKGERVERLLVSAAKQSHKCAVPELHDATKVSDFLEAHAGTAGSAEATAPAAPLKLICYCDEVASLGTEKKDIKEYLSEASENQDIIIMIGPEGDFSRSEIAKAVAGGWKVASLGESRLRIETAAIVATAATYLNYTK